jgi:hypothetical protein
MNVSASFVPAIPAVRQLHEVQSDYNLTELHLI